MYIPGLDKSCEGYQCGNPLDGYEYDCNYEFGISCDDCVCNYGFYNPQTGKRINWLLRIIQRRRAVKYNRNRNNQN